MNEEQMCYYIKPTLHENKIFAHIDWNIFWSRSKYTYMNMAKRKIVSNKVLIQ